MGGEGHDIKKTGEELSDKTKEEIKTARKQIKKGRGMGTKGLMLKLDL